MKSSEFVWTVKECPRCEGYMFDTDDDEKLCRLCKGAGVIPHKNPQIILLGIPIFVPDGFVSFETKKECIAAIKYDDEYFADGLEMDNHIYIERIVTMITGPIYHGWTRDDRTITLHLPIMMPGFGRIESKESWILFMNWMREEMEAHKATAAPLTWRCDNRRYRQRVPHPVRDDPMSILEAIVIAIVFCGCLWWASRV